MVYLIEEIKSYTQQEAAHMLLRYGLFREHGITGPLQLAEHPQGKPYLPDYPGIFFNYSHSGSGVLCAIDTAELGVDIQAQVPYRERLANKICHPSELRQLDETVDKSRLLTRIWTAKESYLKYLGAGIRSDLRDYDLSACTADRYRGSGCFFLTESHAGFSLSVCSLTPVSEICAVTMDKISLHSER